MTQTAVKTGLTPHRWYKVEIAQKNIYGVWGSYSDPKNFETNTEALANVPTGVVLTADLEIVKGAKYKVNLHVEWTPPTTKTDGSDLWISGFDVEYSAYKNSVWTVERMHYCSRDAVSDEWTDGKPDLLYRVRVRAISRGDNPGGWSDYDEVAVTSDTEAPPVPTGLSVTEDGVKIEATVINILKEDVPDFDGFKFYASKTNNFTPADPGEANPNQIQSAKSNKCTFQKFYDGTEVVIGDTVYIKSKSFDENENSSAACAQESVVAGGAAPDAPTWDGTHKLVLDPQRKKGRVYQVKTETSWIPPANLATVPISGYELELYAATYTGSETPDENLLQKTFTPGKNATIWKWSDDDPDQAYSVRIRAISKHGWVGSWSVWSSAAAAIFSVSMPTPTIEAVRQDGTKITVTLAQVSKSDYPDFFGFVIYASKSHTFTPGSGSLVSDGKSTTHTFQQVGNGGTPEALTDIVLGDTIYIRASAVDVLDQEGTICDHYDPPIVAGGAAPNQATGLTLTLTPMKKKGRVYQVKTLVVWIAPTNVPLSGYELEFYEGLNGSGNLQRTLTPGKGSTQEKWTDDEPDQDYSVRIRAISKTGITGAWTNELGVGDWGTANASAVTFTNNLPVPEILSLTQDGTKITVTLAQISKETYPDFFGFVVYASKITGFDPGAGNLVSDGKSTTHTFQKAANSGGTLENIAIGETIFVRVSAIDIDDVETVKCAETSVIAGGSAPSAIDGMELVAITLMHNKSDKYEAQVKWHVATISGDVSEPTYDLWWWENGQTKIHKISKITRNTETYGDEAGHVATVFGPLEQGKVYDWKVRSHNRHGVVNAFCADQSTGTVGSAISAPGLYATPLVTGDDGTTVNPDDAYMEFTWYRVAGLDYQPEMKETSESIWTKLPRIKDPGSGATITEHYGQLKQGVSMDFRVVALRGNTESSPYSTTATLETFHPTIDTPTNPTELTGADELTENGVYALLQMRCDRVAGYDYEFVYGVNGLQDIMLIYRDPGIGDYADVYAYKLPVDTEYGWQVRAVKGNSYSGWTDVRYKTTWKPTDSAVVPPLTQIDLQVRPGSFHLLLSRPSEIGLKGYLIQVSPNNSDWYDIATVGRGIDKVIIPVNTPYNAGMWEILYDTVYYFRGKSLDKWGGSSTYIASYPTSAKLLKSEFLRAFTAPWGMKNKVSFHYKRTTVGVDTHTVSAGKIALLEGYTLDPGVDYTVSIDLYDDSANNFSLEVVTSGSPLIRSPGFTNGIYLWAGCQIKTTISDPGGSSGSPKAKMKILEFDADAAVTLVIKRLRSDTSYSVPSGKGLTLTFAWAFSASNYFQQYLNSAWEDVWDVYGEKWDIGKGCFYAPPSGQIRGGDATNYIQLIGFLGADS